MTIKQKKFVQTYVKTGNATEAAAQAYNAANRVTAAAIGAENLGKPQIKEEIAKAMAKYDITLDSIVKPVADALVAKRQVQIEDDVIEVDTADHNVRLKAAGMAAKWLGIGTESNNSSLHFHISGKGNTYSL